MPSTKSRRGLPTPESVRRAGRKAVGVAAVAASAGVVTGATAADASADMLYLSQGSHGSSVAKLQHALHIHTDGRFTEGTRRAVIALQQHDGLMVDGIVGPQTWDALFHITPAATTTSPTTPSSSSYSSASSTGSSSGSGGYTIPSGIVQCESGGNYSAVNPSSGAGGAYQILPSTWQAYGGQGLPQNASPAEQGRIAAAIYAHQGASAWTC